MKAFQIWIFAFALLFCSCYTTEQIPNKYLVTKIAEVPCDTFIDSPVVFFTYLQGEKIDFEYQPISLMTFSNGNVAAHSDVLFEMKESARKQCADGIINLSQDLAEGKYKVAENFTLDNNRNRDIEYFTYDIRKFTGTAVKIKSKDTSKVRIDSFYIKQKQILAEQKRNNEINKALQEKMNSQPAKNTLGWVLAFTFVAVFTAIFVGVTIK
jgi:hypothetical protein